MDKPQQPVEDRHSFFIRRLKELGLYDPDSDYGGMTTKAVEELSEAFTRQRHSGCSAGVVLEVFYKLMAEWRGDTPPWPRPPIVCFCGSARFTQQMLILAWEYAKAGKIVLSWCALPDSYFDAHPESLGDDQAGIHMAEKEGVREIVDEVHKRKIDLADEVFVINVGGYVGDSTKSEILYALVHGKRVSFLETDSADRILKDLIPGVKYIPS